MANPMRGLDASVKLTRAAVCLKDRGFSFAIRYYNTTNKSKNISPAEAQALVRAGLRIGAVWEEGSPTQASFFNKAKGIAHGKTAFGMARTIGQPSDTPIYFAVDYDALRSDLAAGIKQYFEGIHEGFQSAGANSPNRYQVGVYGSGLTCTKLLEGGLATFTWLAGSTGFQGSREFARQKKYNLIQFLPQDVCGVNVDPDETNPDKPSGLFTIPLL